jgi:CelD/BcsL family acetyltransferase involved in cellulose biosynthesis
VWSERRWKDWGGSTAFMTPAVHAFQEQVTERALEQGWLLMYVLRLGGEAAAVMYGFNYGGRFYFYQHGFDDRYKAQSLGLVLMGLTIRAVIEAGACEFDMLWGVEPYKFLWAREVCALQRIELFPPNLRGTLHRRALEIRRKARKLTGQLLSISVTLELPAALVRATNSNVPVKRVRPAAVTTSVPLPPIPEEN